MTPDRGVARPRRHRLPGGHRATSIPRLGLMRSDAPTVRTGLPVSAGRCFAAQGRKTDLGRRAGLCRRFRHYLAVALDLPVMARITEASPEAPHLVIRLSLDPFCSRADARYAGGGGAAQSGSWDRADGARSARRGAADGAADRPAGGGGGTGALVEREILWRLLLGPQGPMLRQIALADSRLARVGRAIGWIRAHFDQPLRDCRPGRARGDEPRHAAPAFPRRDGDEPAAAISEASAPA